MSKISQISIIIFLFIVFGVTASAVADWKDNAKAIKISGGQEYSLILTQNKYPFGAGRNNNYALGIGENTTSQFTPVRVHKPIGSEYLDNVADISAGSVFSLILDVNTSVFAVGNNQQGENGDGTTEPHYTPALVHGINGSYLENIAAISASWNHKSFYKFSLYFYPKTVV